MRILVLPDTNPTKIETEGQKWAFFRYWPEGSYEFDWIGAYQVPLWSRWVEGKLISGFLTQSVRALWKESSYDVIIAHGSRSVIGLALLHRLLGRWKPKLVVFDIESFGRPRSGWRLWVVRQAVEALDAVLYHARPQEDYYSAYLPQLEGKTHFIPLGIGMSTKPFSWDEIGRGEFILSVDTTAPRRREWDVLIRACRRLRDPPRLRIIGKTRWSSEELGEEDLPAGIELVPRMPAPELRKLMQQCTLAVLPLFERGHAHGQLSLLELMAAGAPVVVSDTAGVRDYVRHGETALLYSSGNSDQLAERIQWALEHPSERRALGRRAREAVKERFSGERFSQRIYQLIAGLTSDSVS